MILRTTTVFDSGQGLGSNQKVRDQGKWNYDITYVSCQRPSRGGLGCGMLEMNPQKW